MLISNRILSILYVIVKKPCSLVRSPSSPVCVEAVEYSIRWLLSWFWPVTFESAVEAQAVSLLKLSAQSAGRSPLLPLRAHLPRGKAALLGLSLFQYLMFATLPLGAVFTWPHTCVWFAVLWIHTHSNEALLTYRIFLFDLVTLDERWQIWQVCQIC